MAYKINRDSEHVVVSEGFAQVSDVHRVRSEIAKNTPEFYELEPAEVIAVYLDSDSLINAYPKPLVLENDKPDWSKYGYISARMSISNEGDEDRRLIAPLDSNIKDYPRPGEHVIVATYYGSQFYTQKINMTNSVNLNVVKGLSRTWNPAGAEPYNIKQFKPISDVREIQSDEGDITFNGRFGQSIRFGSNITEIEGKEENTGKENSANILIRAGQGIIPKEDRQPVKENINLDGSSIWMTTDQLVPIEHESSEIRDLDPKFKTDNSGNQVTITSDRLVFNSRVDTFLYSSQDINLVSKRRVVIEGHGNVYLGSAPTLGKGIGYFANGAIGPKPFPNIQPVLAGDTLIKILHDLMDKLAVFCDTAKGTKGTCINIPVPLDTLFGACSQLKDGVKQAQANLDKAKSEKVFVQLK